MPKVRLIAGGGGAGVPGQGERNQAGADGNQARKGDGEGAVSAEHLRSGQVLTDPGNPGRCVVQFQGRTPLRCKVYPFGWPGQYNPGMKITVRPANREDATTITDFNLAMAAETEDKGLSADVLQAGVEGVFDFPERAVYRVAESEGEIVGSLMVTTEWSDWRNGILWWIQSVYVRPEFRRRGVYRALHEDVCDAAMATEGVCGVRLYV